MEEQIVRQKIILASNSPRRRQLLQDAGYQVVVIAPSASEDIPEGENDPHKITMLLARRKAESVCRQVDKGIVLGADTVVFCNGEIIGKPANDADALYVLKKLNGTTHKVVTGICIIDAETGKLVCGSDETVVVMRKVSDEQIRDYVRSGESAGAAGAYKLQEKGDQFVEKIIGSYSNVVGLPLELLADKLEMFMR